jgi:DNA-binding CsgD family transcriptional regulator
MPAIDMRRGADLKVSSEMICGAVEAVGKASFATELLRSSRAFAPVDFVSVFLFPNPVSPVFFGTDGIPGRRYAELAANQYVKHYYQEDPNIDEMFVPSDFETKITYLDRDTIPTVRYRLSCYDRAHILDRVSLLSRTAAGIPFSVSFYGGFVSGPLGEEGMRCLNDFLPLARSLALRHIEMARPVPSSWIDALARVRVRFPDLSKRESDVVTGVLLNMTAAQTATKLGIAATSVITHRQRAYDRLGVKDMRQLVKLLYEA